MEHQHRFAVDPPSWYSGEQPWVELEPSQRILQGLQQNNRQALDDAVIGAGYGVRGPISAKNENVLVVAAVLAYAARDREEVEIYIALKWLAATGRLLRL